MPDKLNVLVFAGGLGLGAYHAGAYQAFPLPLHWCCGASVGAVTAVLIAGNRPEARLDALRTYWEQDGAEPARRTAGPSRHAFAWLSALGTRLLGSYLDAQQADHAFRESNGIRLVRRDACPAGG